MLGSVIRWAVPLCLYTAFLLVSLSIFHCTSVTDILLSQTAIITNPKQSRRSPPQHAFFSLSPGALCMDSLIMHMGFLPGSSGTGSLGMSAAC